MVFLKLISDVLLDLLRVLSDSVNVISTAPEFSVVSSLIKITNSSVLRITGIGEN